MTDAPPPRIETLSDDEIGRLLQGIAEDFRSQLRAPVLHMPDEVGLEFEDVTFPSSDGVPLEGWFIPAPGAERVVVANHPSGFSRSGLPTHLEPWRSRWEPTATGPRWTSSRTTGSCTTPATTCWPTTCATTASAALRYVRSRPDTRESQIGRLHWVRGTTRRWDGYREFQRRPESVLDWLDTTMITAAEAVAR